MNVMLDYLGAIIIGGIVLIAMTSFFLFATDNATSKNNGAIVQSNLANLNDILEFDFRQMGYRVSNPVKITRADSNRITFRSDFDDNGTVDSIQYYLGSTKSPGSANPRVRQLFRRLNTQTPHPIDASVTRFRLWYFDSTGAQSNVLANLRSLRVLVNLQTQYENDSIRAGITWDRVFKPSNLR